MPSKSNFLDKVLGRIGRLDSHGLQTVVTRLARERDFLETVFNAIEDGVLVLDETGRILYFNEAVMEMIGIPENGAEGQPVERFLPDLTWDQLATTDDEGGQSVVRHEFEVSYPKSRFLTLYATPLDGISRGSSGLALILHDATEARQRTFEAIESERIQALTLLAGSVAHEIGNPLNALHIHLQLMEREIRKLKQTAARASAKGQGNPSPLAEAGEMADKLDTYVQVAKGEITRLDYILTQFLQAIRPSEPQLELASLNDVVNETLNLLSPEFENRGQIIHRELKRDLPKAPMDAGQMKQVLVNLMKNAMHAMAKGGALTVRTDAGRDEVWVSVSDTGGGIPPERLKHIFEPFFTTKEKGSGLGLMIVQRIVRAHGGRIELDSRTRQGTTFRVWLPLRERQTRLLEARPEP